MAVEKLATDMNGQFTKEEAQMATEQMNRCSVAPASREMQIQTARYNSTTVGQEKKFKSDKPKGYGETVTANRSIITTALENRLETSQTEDVHIPEPSFFSRYFC